MAILRIYPEKDATVYSELSLSGNSLNTGADEILTISSYYDKNLSGQVSRALLQFNSQEIQDCISKVGNTFETNLHLYLANATELPSQFSVEAHAISGSWDEGTGRFQDSPDNRSGVSWYYRDAQQLLPWTSPGVDLYPYSSSLSMPRSSAENFDLDLNTTSIIQAISSSTIPNTGFLLKFEDSIENLSGSLTALHYFSSNSHTIYSPYLEFRWNDALYSSSIQEIPTENLKISVKNLKNSYNIEEKKRFRLNVRETLPTRTFSTSSLYTQNYILPSGSQWAIQDVYTGDLMIDFHPQYTQISADESGNYFDIYLNTLHPHRFYKVLVKSEIDSNIIITDTKGTFTITDHV